ncbi:putative DNA ligase I [Pseudovirgaria hyperparasitica]|uniref:DNA ligase n=1 Tax=Pseudovirgaria hyperparasitica TaxID=470096 RepID=A0A6A6W7M8_9PEZI|nr:putative DNA ligase I [Pseudovirgaria hyperparasitica]KAF2758209.1 putative DNA ligase I [Pseudovirgaria hyperparasitica]
MSSPAKKRKKKDDAEPKPQVRSLDYFFGKQRSLPANDVQRSRDEGGMTGGFETLVNEERNQSVIEDANHEELTDEQLARKLQEEFDRENQTEQRAQNADAPSYPLDDTTSSTIDGMDDKKSPQEVAKQSFSFRPGATAKQTLSLQSASATEDTITNTIPFDESPLIFEPSKYVPQLKDLWAPENGSATYALLTRCFILVNSTQSRIKIVDTLVNLLRTIIVGDPESLLPAVWLATNSISPPYIDLELGLGGSAISKALKKVCGLDNTSLKSLYNKHGDAGDVAFEAKKRQTFTLRKPKPLTIKIVFECLVKIANSRGTGSQEVKQRIVERLVQDARGAEESRYIVRTLVQHLRIGAVKTTMLIALSRAFLLSRPPTADFKIESAERLRKLRKEDLTPIYTHAEEIVKASFARRPNYNDLIPTLLDIGVTEELLLRCGLAMHIPLRPMLGSITRDLQEMLVKLQGRDFACEYKYDGQRAQVHCDKEGKVTIFSRHLEVMTDKYPDLVCLVPKIRGEGVESFILEGEVVALDRDTGELKAFQTLANRARKDVLIGNVTIDVCLFSFDLMYLNGQELTDRPFRERRELLRSLFIEIPHHFTWVKSMDATSTDSEAVLEFFKSALEYKCEGIMVKVLDNVVNPDLAVSGVDDDGLEADAEAPRTPSKKRKKADPKTQANASKDEKQKGRRKALLSTYEPDKRLDSWLKVKKDYDSAAADTLDLIPIAGWYGQGRKNKWWSPILLAVRNPETGNLQAVTKCISGFTDKFYQENRKKYDPDVSFSDDEDGEDADGVVRKNNTLPSKPSYVEYFGSPDVWFNPQEVWEMAFADITLSPVYPAAIGLVNEDRGLSLRFPRFLKVREDKGIEEASDADFLASLWRKQEAKGKTEAVARDGNSGRDTAEYDD